VLLTRSDPAIALWENKLVSGFQPVYPNQTPKAVIIQVGTMMGTLFWVHLLTLAVFVLYNQHGWLFGQYAWLFSSLRVSIDELFSQYAWLLCDLWSPSLVAPQTDWWNFITSMIQNSCLFLVYTMVQKGVHITTRLLYSCAWFLVWVCRQSDKNEYCILAMVKASV
jgi:hypothetical protein